MCKGGGGDRKGNHVLMSYEKSLDNLSSAFFEKKSQYRGIKSNYVPTSEVCLRLCSSLHFSVYEMSWSLLKSLVLIPYFALCVLCLFCE